MRSGPLRWSTVRVLALAVGAVLPLASCGLPGDGDVERLSDDAVPYELLESAVPSPGGVVDGGDTKAAPQVFWLLEDDDQLIADTAETSCGEEPAVVVDRVLDELAAGPRDAARAAGRSTAIPPESGLVLVRIVDGTAEIEVDPATSISADRLPAAVGQIVLTVTSAPGVVSVLLVSATSAVPVPLPGGALADGPVTAEDYADFLPERAHDAQGAGCPEP